MTENSSEFKSKNFNIIFEKSDNTKEFVCENTNGNKNTNSNGCNYNTSLSYLDNKDLAENYNVDTEKNAVCPQEIDIEINKSINKNSTSKYNNYNKLNSNKSIKTIRLYDNKKSSTTIVNIYEKESMNTEKLSIPIPNSDTSTNFKILSLFRKSTLEKKNNNYSSLKVVPFTSNYNNNKSADIRKKLFKESNNLNSYKLEEKNKINTGIYNSNNIRCVTSYNEQNKKNDFESIVTNTIPDCELDINNLRSTKNLESSELNYEINHNNKVEENVNKFSDNLNINVVINEESSCNDLNSFNENQKEPNSFKYNNSRKSNLSINNEDHVDINNISISLKGKSSSSYISQDNYKIFKSQLKNLNNMINYKSEIDKIKYKHDIEEEFDYKYRLENNILFKEGLLGCYKKYNMILKRNMLVLINTKKLPNKTQYYNNYKELVNMYSLNKSLNKDHKRSCNLEEFERIPHIVLDFDTISVMCNVNFKDKIFKLKVLSTNKEFVFKYIKSNKKRVIDDKVVFNKILNYLQYFISNSKGNKELLLNVCLKKNIFYKYYHLHESQLTNRANTGDILLFRGLECPSKCQRSLTCETYDHVALLIKKNNNLYVYETLAKDGAKLRHWKDFTRFYWNLLYERIVFRKLIIKNNNINNLDNTINYTEEETLDEIEKKFLDFIKKTEKMPYRITFNKLFCYGKPRHYELKYEWNKAKGFYCSSLLAAAFMHAGIMKIDHCAGKYRPGYFASDKTKQYLSLNDNYDLGAELMIDFNYNEL